MLSDQEIKDAIAERADMVLARVQKAALEIAGTRSQQAHYHMQVQQAITGTLTGTIEAWQYGKIQLKTNQLYIVSLLSTRRFGNAVKLLAYVEVPESKKDEIVKAHAERIKTLSPSK